MEIRQLTYFLTVAREQNFSEAARQLHISQPALSRSIKRLEEEIGVELFRRKPHNLVLTDQGRLLETQAKIILAQVKKAKESVNKKVSSAKKLSVGFMSYTMLAFGTDFTSFFRSTFAGHELEMKEYFSQTQLEQDLSDGKLDLIFHFPPTQHEDLLSQLVYTEEIVAYIASNHPKADKPFLEADDLLNESYIMPNDDANPAMMKKFRRFFKEHGKEVHIIQRSGPHQTRLSLVAAGMGICLDGLSVQKRLNLPGVIVKPVAEELKSFVLVSIGWRRIAVPFCIDELLYWFATRQSKKRMKD